MPQSSSAASAGRLALRDRLVEHLRLQRVDDGEDELLRHYRRILSPAYFSPSRRRPPSEQHDERRDREQRERRHEARRSPRASAAATSAYAVSSAAWSGSSRVRTRSTRPPTASQPSAAQSGPSKQPDPGLVPVVRERPGEEQRAQGQPDHPGQHVERVARRPPAVAARAPRGRALHEEGCDPEHHDRRQERRGLEEAEVGAVEVDARCRRARGRPRAAAGGRAGRRWPTPGRRRCPMSRKRLMAQMSGSVPCGAGG